jgi:hypothetical protein
MSIDQQAVVAAYQSSRLTVPAVAALYGLKPADVGAILRLNGVAIRKGNVSGVNNLTAEARARGQQVRSAKALDRLMFGLILKHGPTAVQAAYDRVFVTLDTNADAQ